MEEWGCVDDVDTGLGEVGLAVGIDRIYLGFYRSDQ